MKRSKGSKMTLAGLSLAIAAAVCLIQVDTASPGTPGVCKEACDEESGTAQLPVQAQEVERDGAMGYRVPLVVRQPVPAQIRGGVYVPAHETYVVLQPGHWEAQGAAEDPAAASEAAEAPQAAKGGWLRRLFRKLGRCDGGS